MGGWWGGGGGGGGVGGGCHVVRSRSQSRALSPGGRGCRVSPPLPPPSPPSPPPPPPPCVYKQRRQHVHLVSAVSAPVTQSSPRHPR